jgi:hypothetical protein
MSGFRGSRRLMARILERRKAKQANRPTLGQRMTSEEIAARLRLSAEASTPFAPGETRLVKQAPKPSA